MSAIHLLARVVLINNGHILLAHEIGAENTLMPLEKIARTTYPKTVVLHQKMQLFTGMASWKPNTKNPSVLLFPFSCII